MSDLIEGNPRAAGVSAPAGGATRNLQVNSLVLIVANAATGLLGLVFWAIAAQLDSAVEVGRASVLITAATMIATLSNLSFGPVFERFLAGFGSRATHFVLLGFACCTGCALVLGALLVLVGPREELFESTLDAVLFPVFVCVLAWFALQDQTASALGVARWGGYQNIGHSVLKLVVVALIPGASCAMIVGSWAVPALICVGVLGAVLIRRLRTSVLATGPVHLPPRRELLAYFGSSYGIQVIGTSAPLAIPLVVVASLGAEQTAYFALAWALVTAVFLLGSTLVGPFVAEAAAHPADLRHLIRRFAILIGVLSVGSSFFLAVCAPLVLGFIGPDYGVQGSPLLYLAACIIPLWLIGIVYDAIARIQRRLALAVFTQCLLALVSIVGSALLVPRFGIAGVGIAYLVATAVNAILVGGSLIRGFRLLAAGDPQSQIEEDIR